MIVLFRYQNEFSFIDKKSRRLIVLQASRACDECEIEISLIITPI